MPDVFNNDEPAGVDQLVGEGKKFKTVEDLVRGYNASQEHITKIEGENADFRRDMGTRETVEEQLRRYAEEQRKQAPNDPPQDNTRRETEQREPVDLDKRIREVLNNTQENQRKQTNLQEVVSTLVDTFGDETKANEAVRRRAAEVGLSVEDLQNLAARSPKAAYDLFGIDKQRPRAESTAPRGNVNTQGLGQADRIVEGTKRYYDRMKKDNPGLYNMPATQAQRMKDAQKLGDAFFDM